MYTRGHYHRTWPPKPSTFEYRPIILACTDRQVCYLTKHYTDQVNVKPQNNAIRPNAMRSTLSPRMATIALFSLNNIHKQVALRSITICMQLVTLRNK